MSPLFFSLPLALCLPVAYFLFFSSSIFHIENRDFIDSLVVSASQDAGGYAISRKNNLELPFGVAIPVD